MQLLGASNLSCLICANSHPWDKRPESLVYVLTLLAMLLCSPLCLQH